MAKAGVLLSKISILEQKHNSPCLTLNVYKKMCVLISTLHILYKKI